MCGCPSLLVIDNWLQISWRYEWTTAQWAIPATTRQCRCHRCVAPGPESWWLSKLVSSDRYKLPHSLEVSAGHKRAQKLAVCITVHRETIKLRRVLSQMQVTTISHTSYAVALLCWLPSSLFSPPALLWICKRRGAMYESKRRVGVTNGVATQSTVGG